MNEKTSSAPSYTRTCTCGGVKFSAHQVSHADVIVDGNNEFLSVNGDDLEGATYYSGTPFGPYRCRKCGKEYGELEDIPLTQS